MTEIFLCDQSVVYVRYTDKDSIHQEPPHKYTVIVSIACKLNLWTEKKTIVYSLRFIYTVLRKCCFTP